MQPPHSSIPQLIALLKAAQHRWRFWAATSAFLLLSMLWYHPLLLLFCVYSCVLVLAAIVGTMYVYHLLSTRDMPEPNKEPLTVLYNATKAKLFDLPTPIENASNLPLIFGKTVDLQLQQIIEYILRDFMTSWLEIVVSKPKLINEVVREDVWNAIQKIHDRALKMDPAKIIAVDMVNRVTVHLEKIRIAEARALESGTAPIFSTNFYLHTEEKELEFLRKLCELMIILLLPRGYSISPLKLLLSELLSYKIFFPVIKLLTSPDWINQQIVQSIESRLAAEAISKRSYDYSASFEDFMKVINGAVNLEELSLIRKSIVNDLMHATTMQNLQQTKAFNFPGFLSDKEDQSLTKSERYIQQLIYAKNQCEKKLSNYGWNGKYASDEELPLAEVLSTTVGRRYLTLFLEPLKASALVGFYNAVEEMKQAPSANLHQMGTEIFYAYVRVPKPELQIDKQERKMIETFLVGDAGPEVFYNIQRQVFKDLEDKYYPSFVLSEQCRQLKEALNVDSYKDAGILLPPLLTLNDSQEPNVHEEVGSTADNGGNHVSTIGMDVATHTTYARKKIEQLDERLEKKNQALDALKHSVKPESKVLQILEKEMDWLKSEKRQTEAHLRRTDAWTDHLGQWKATIQSVEVTDEAETLQFMILVHVDDDINAPYKGSSANAAASGSNEPRSGAISSGWVVMRSLNQVHELHRKLRHVCPDLKSLDLPINFKFFFLKNDRNSLEKAKGQIQKFLNFILEDDHLNGSEAIYSFLSPSSDHLKQALPSPKKSKFSLATLFKSDTPKLGEKATTDPFWGLMYNRDKDEEDITMSLDGNDVVSDNAKIFSDGDNRDSIAEPLYALMGEVFDMGGVFKWLRKSIISFVQITYGRTINRQIRESVAYLFEESMLHFYCTTVLKTVWPGGVLIEDAPERSDDMKEMTTNAAKALLMDNIPEVLCNIVGAQNAKQGVLKVFDALQNPIYNKQLFYELLEIVMLELFPEIRQLKVNGTTVRITNATGTNANNSMPQQHSQSQSQHSQTLKSQSHQMQNKDFVRV